MDKIRINEPPARTFRWLKMNETVLDGPVLSCAAKLNAEVPAGVETGGPALSMETGLGADGSALLRGAAGESYLLAEGQAPEEPLRLSWSFSDGDAAAADFTLRAGSRLTVVMDYRSEGAGAAGVRVLADLGENALLRLVQIQRAGEDFCLFNGVGANCAAGARLEIIRLFLGGRESYDGCKVLLTGDGSSLDVCIGYRAARDERLDMNYAVEHLGKKTRCNISASGVLRDRAQKLFRGTIDLKKGCAGAEGNENEDVLLMDETARSQTVPVILCAEEDVVGNHGCTIGRLSEELIFYLQSRGMDPESIYEMMAAARIDAVIRRIPDEITLRRLFPELAAEKEEA